MNFIIQCRYQLLFQCRLCYGNIAYYCKRGYFRWGKISRKCWQDISRGGNFHDAAPICFIKAFGFYFRTGVIFAKKTKARKTRILTPRENFHVYSILYCNMSAKIDLNFVVQKKKKFFKKFIESERGEMCMSIMV